MIYLIIALSIIAIYSAARYLFVSAIISESIGWWNRETDSVTQNEPLPICYECNGKKYVMAECDECGHSRKVKCWACSGTGRAERPKPEPSDSLTGDIPRIVAEKMLERIRNKMVISRYLGTFQGSGVWSNVSIEEHPIAHIPRNAMIYFGGTWRRTR
jgi:hypothetical protein